MSQSPDYANLLLEWLPAVWRERDETGELGKLLEVYGELLDAFHATITQRLNDSFPDQNDNGDHCQAWLLPYFAQLLDVRLVSPDESGRRAELRDAVAWRQRKGTQVSIEAIAQAVGGFEVEIQEGWKRVAITPRVDRPLLPESAYGEPAIPESAGFDRLAGHPGLPAASLDLRRCSRAVRSDAGNSAAHKTNFQGQPIIWRQVNRHGLPCAPGSFQDVSRRTLDLRTPDPTRGHYHPRRVLLYLPPPEGHCSARAPSMNWSEITGFGTFDGLHLSIRTLETTWNGQKLPLIVYTGLGDVPVKLRGITTLNKTAIYRFENLWLDNRVEITHGAAQLRGCAARHLKVFTAELDAPVIDAKASLFKRLEAARGLVRLEYATVLDTLLAETLEASDSILMPRLRKDTVDNDVPRAGCIRYSRLFHIPPPPVAGNPDLINDVLWVAQGKRSALRCTVKTCTTELPLFWNDDFGHPGCGVLRPSAKDVFQFGAEDGGEMGACHEYRYSLRQRAVLDKLQEFLPLGVEAVLVFDPTLTCPPPKPTHN